MIRNDFVSNSSSSSFILRKSELDNLKIPFDVKWHDIDLKNILDGLFYDIISDMFWDYEINYYDKDVKLNDLVDFTFTDEAYADLYFGRGNEFLYMFPPSVQNEVESIAFTMQQLLDLRYNKDKCDDKIKKQKKKLLESEYYEFSDIILEKVKNILAKYCKINDFVTTTLSDDYCDYNSSYEYHMTNLILDNKNILSFYRIINEH